MKSLAALALTVASLTLPAHALAAGPLTKVVDGRPHVFPIIGTYAYSASCTLTHAWEDHSAMATCSEDGAAYVFDPEANAWYVKH